ncbi:methionine--tRNA ligase [Anaerorhabdus sp.]|uniref:methionine--tRNA ligase n=1 Tax=Anaerorhabdus sp. TaxID=1872524 RepID=UPI002B2114D9|nr:methionine--tRNA ligase [Anaerorhabdus sp.]MEA4875608.1 methionine--tRNA ligase [Anaerorhabdus sp.]
MENKGKYYITTAIAYTSGKPHIGNVYEIVLADAIARYKRMVGYDVRFQTGTDEHGQKIEDKAKAANKSPQQFVDEIADIIKGQFDTMNVSYDKFMRTTDPYHEKQVQKIFKKLYEQGDIYKSEYEGLYCKQCEAFFTESQLVDGKCPDCGRDVEIAKEEAYFFKMSKYADRLMKHIEDHPSFIQPESRKNEMVNNFIKPGLQDLCVSRTSFKWGIPVDFDPKHVVYVWIDALTNYITGLGFDLDGNHGELFKKYWPADVHLIGKDILRFHTIYWPIMLMALDIELPKQVFGHPWLLVGEGKMSKSKGNVIYADDLCRFFGVDAVRYIMLHEMPFAQDGTITYELMIERINSDLANIFGNLVNRTITMSNKYFGGLVENTNCKGEFDDELIQVAKETVSKVNKKMDELKVADAIDEIITLLRRSNKYIDETTPWTLGKDEAQHERLKTVLYNLLESIRIAAVLIKPFLPETSEKILNQLNTNQKDYDSILEFGNLEQGIHVTDKPEILFARLDEKEMLEKIEAETVKPQVKVSKLPEITIEDFAKVEMVVGQVISCEKHPKADKLLVSQIDIGGEVRQIVSGIATSYKPEDMVGKKVCVIINLKPANLRGVESQGMILAGATDKQIEVLSIQDLPIGTQVK